MGSNASERPRKVTLKDVSRAAGLSLITVSRALRQPDTVQPKTRAKVQDAIDALGYIPNLTARSLVSQRSDMIGVVVPILASSLFADFAQGVSRVLEAEGQQMLLAVTGWSPQKEEEAVRTFIARQADAIIVTGFVHTETTRKLLSNFPGPVIETWNVSPDVIDAAVGFDNRTAAAEMTRYLIGKGYRDIVLAGGGAPNNDQAMDRTRGFRDAMEAAGRPIGPGTIVPFDHPASIESGGTLLDELRARPTPPDAVFFVAELPAQGAMLRALSLGVDVPGEIAIAGFGDLSLSSLLPVPMTTVQIKGREIGEKAGQLVLRRLGGDATDAPMEDVGFNLQIRDST